MTHVTQTGNNQRKVGLKLVNIFICIAGSSWSSRGQEGITEGSEVNPGTRAAEVTDCVCVTYSQHGVLLDFVRKAVEEKKKGFYLNRKEKKRQGREEKMQYVLEVVPVSDPLRIMTDL